MTGALLRCLIPYSVTRPQWINNSLAPGKFEWNFRHVIFKQILVIDGWGIACEITLMWMSLDLTDDQSTLVQVMAWCRKATSHYLSQCWPRSLSPYGVTGPQWVNRICWNLLVLLNTGGFILSTIRVCMSGSGSHTINTNMFWIVYFQDSDTQSPNCIGIILRNIIKWPKIINNVFIYYCVT